MRSRTGRRDELWRLCGEVDVSLKFTRGDGLKKGGRYDASGLVETQYEIGSNDTVLRNLLSIIDPDEMDQAENRNPLPSGID